MNICKYVVVAGSWHGGMAVAGTDGDRRCSGSITVGVRGLCMGAGVVVAASENKNGSFEYVLSF